MFCYILEQQVFAVEPTESPVLSGGEPGETRNIVSFVFISQELLHF